MDKLLVLAKVLSETFHQHQKYGTADYFHYHVSGVVNSLKLHNLPDEYLIVGYLHDIVEDTTVSLNTISDLFGECIGEAVSSITKHDDETRENYLVRCSSNKIARIVKLHDAMFNATNCFKNKNKSKYNYYLNTISLLGA